MPFYEYQCDNCNHQFETLQKMSDKPLKDCPKCGKSSLKKLVSAPSNFDLKGDGWYKPSASSKDATSKVDSVAACSQPKCGDTGTCQASSAKE
jgi:putative FmdB family regulatory protein